MHVARDPRRKVAIRATMLASGPPADVCIRDISSRGMLLQASAPPQRGTCVEIWCSGHQIVGVVHWCKDRRFGVRLRDRINVHAFEGGAPAEILDPHGRTAGASPRPAARPGAGSSRARAGGMEFAVVAIFAAALVAALGITAFETLSRPIDAVSTHLKR
jgi:hypothetical protein